MLQTSRARQRVGREVTYFPTDAQAVAGGGAVGDSWFARISAVNDDGTVNLAVVEADGGALAVTDVPRGQRKGTFDFKVRGGAR